MPPKPTSDDTRVLTSAATFEPVDEQRIPRAEKRPVTTTRHGVTLTDDYAWLKAPNWQAVMRDPRVLDPAIRAYLKAENAHADAVFAGTRALRDELFAEMKGRTEDDDSTVPAPDGPYAYFRRFRQDGQYPLYCRTRDGGTEELLLDGDALAAGKPSFDLDATAQSPDHRLLVWTCDEVGSESYVARVRDLASGTDLADLVPDLAESPVWTADSSAFYYVRLDEEERPTRVFRHRVGTAADDDVLIYESNDPEYSVGITQLQSRCFAEISARTAESAESWLLDLRIPDARPTPIAARDPSMGSPRNLRRAN